MKYDKTGFSIIYLFFLITFITFFGIIVLDKQSFFQNNLEYSMIKDILSKEILTKGSFLLSTHIQNNTYSGFYLPFLSCPTEVKLMSGSQLLSWGNTVIFDNYCSGTLNNKELQLFFTGSYQTFGSGIYDSSGFTISKNISFSGQLSPNLNITFDSNEIDDRFIKGRLEINGIMIKNSGYRNIFWVNDEIRKFINKNQNNTGSFLNIGQVSSGALFFDVTDSFSGEIIEFDKNIFNSNNKLVKIDKINFFSSGGVIGYLQNNLTFSGSLGTPKLFDFKNKDYGIFLSYSTGVLDNIRYKLKIFSQNGTGVYITPIKDDTNSIEHLGNNILLNNGHFYNKIYKLIDYK